MASAYKIQVPASNSGLLGFTQTDASAEKVTELLQKDLETHHVFFNESGFHNHIVHHLLTIFGTSAPPAALQHAFEENASYQLKAAEPSTSIVNELQADWNANAPKYFGDGKHYADFLKFFQTEIERDGWQTVVKEYALNGDAKSEPLFVRLWAGFLHPLIQLMYGIEWEQPAIVAEGLAQAAVHKDQLSEFLAKAEEAAKDRSDTFRTLPEIFEAVHKIAKLKQSVKWGDSNRVYDGVLKRALDEVVELASQITVKPDELDERTVEMFHTAAYMATSSVFHSPNVPKFDFFLIHHLNSAPFFLSVNKMPQISTAVKVRLLEWKMRLDIVQFIARGTPPLHLDHIKHYAPKDNTLVPKPVDLLPRFHMLSDDGHFNKIIRAFLIAQEISREYAGRSWIRIADDETWLKAHYLLLDSATAGGPSMVRAAGFDEAWGEVPLAT